MTGEEVLTGGDLVDHAVGHRRVGGQRHHGLVATLLGTSATDADNNPLGLAVVGLAAAATFAVAIASITAFEAITGEPVSTLTGGDAGGGTTLGRAVDSGAGTTIIDPDPAPTTSTPTTPPTTEPPSPTPTETPTPTDTTTTPTTPPPTSPPPTSEDPPPT